MGFVLFCFGVVDNLVIWFFDFVVIGWIFCSLFGLCSCLLWVVFDLVVGLWVWFSVGFGF